jgi:hypothetical protein
MTDAPARQSFEKWLWIELLGFDNEAPDFGVQEYLDTAGFVPQALSFLLYSPDFVHTHEGMAQERVLPPEFCSYTGRPYSKIRTRQAWTNWQLRGLIEELHKHAIAVYCSFFNMFTAFIDGELHQSPWCAAHPELWETNREGQATPAINPLRRFTDGSYYEDFFVGKLAEVMDDYGFDGFHGADGYSCTRQTIYLVDFSDDMVGQFEEWIADRGGRALESAPMNGDAEAMRIRAEVIWRNHRAEWARFYAARWQGFWRKVVDALHARQRKIVFNNAWTRDPFQALYRYGIDYKMIEDVGVDGFVVETVAAGVSIGGEGGIEASPHYDFMAMLMLMKAYTPNMDLHCLNGTLDIFEQWDVLHHAPTAWEREIYSLTNLYRWDSKGALQRCYAGPVVCLATEIESDAWRSIREKWERAISFTPQRVIGPTVVWSDGALSAQLGDFIATRRWTSHKIVHELMAAGAPILAVTRVEDLAGVAGPLLVPNPHLFPAEDLARVFAYQGGPIILIGDAVAAPREPDLSFVDVHGPSPLQCAVWGAAGASEVTVPADDPEDIPEDLMALPEPGPYMFEPYFRKVSRGFVGACVAAILEGSRAPLVLARAEVVHVTGIEQEPGQMRLFIGNDSHYYVVTEIDVRQEIASIQVVTEFPGVPIEPVGSRFGVKVPGKGMVIVDIQTNPA